MKKKILRTMKANGSPAPTFETDEERSSYLVRLLVHPRADKLVGQVTGQVTGQADMWIIDVLRQCQRVSLKSAEIQTLTGIKHRGTFQRNYLDRLIEEGFIERTIPEKPTSRNQKYRLTEKGRRALSQNESGTGT